MEANPPHSSEEPTDILRLCRAIAETSPIPTAELNPVTKTITCVNFAFCLLTGKSKEALVGRSLASVVPDAEKCLHLLAEINITGRAGSGEGLGPVCWTYTMWPVVVGQSGISAVIMQVTEATRAGQDAVLVNQALLLGALRQHELIEAAELLNTQLRAEMLARKATEKALIRSEKLAVAGRMAAVLAHEINNPLAGAMELLYRVKTSDGITPEALTHVDQADGELRRIAHIARQTLGFYRSPDSLTTFSLRALIVSVLDLLKARLHATGAKVEIQCDMQLDIRANYGEIRQVLSNLILNSLDALERGGRLSIRATETKHTQRREPLVRILVADNGNGMISSVVDHIFEAFYTTKRNIGNGLGLWVCKELIGHHGGTMRVRSRTREPQRGTSIAFTLPAIHS